MFSMEMVSAAQRAERHPSVVRRAYDTVLCWWVLLRARLRRDGKPDPEVEHCLQLQKGTRFLLSGGEIRFVDPENNDSH
jgi:hypothetical protein